jgi:hypothetical protein
MDPMKYDAGNQSVKIGGKAVVKRTPNRGSDQTPSNATIAQLVARESKKEPRI